jgi:plastocyanin
VNTPRSLLRTSFALAAVTALSLVACGGDDDGAGAVATTAPEAAATITIESFAFSGVTEVPAGTVLTVINNDTAPHTFTATDGSFDSGALNPEDAFQVVLDTPGTYTYSCAFHPSMTGTITVT